jgi:homoaconitase/3-isopropylmalate dehydratase large subunit
MNRGDHAYNKILQLSFLKKHESLLFLHLLKRNNEKLKRKLKVNLADNVFVLQDHFPPKEICLKKLMMGNLSKFSSHVNCSCLLVGEEGLHHSVGVFKVVFTIFTSSPDIASTNNL